MSDPATRESRHVRRMFDGIARRYDFLNHLLSLNRDRAWRRRAAREAVADAPALILDLCGGTGDLALAVAEAAPARVICCDFSHEMLSRAEPKFARRGLHPRCRTVEADGLRLPFGDACFDAVTVGFGVRNFQDMDAGLRQIRRVLRPGGRLVILEFSQPERGAFGRLYRTYLSWLLPRIGDSVAGRQGPYAYLAQTIAGFPDPPALAGRIRDAGFGACGWTTHTGGIVAIHTAFR